MYIHTGYAHLSTIATIITLDKKHAFLRVFVSPSRAEYVYNSKYVPHVLDIVGNRARECLYVCINIKVG